jgi:amidase
MADVINHQPDIYHLTIGPHKPAMRLQSGQRVCVNIPDCDGLGPDGIMLPREKFEINADAPITVANPTAGAYHIEGADIGDSIAVYIEEVKIDRDFGRTGISVKQVAVAQEFFAINEDEDFNVIMPKKIYRWEIDHASNLAKFKCNNSKKKQVEVELNPFPGCIAVAPQNGQFVDGLGSGTYGGNMDVPLAGVGACVYLPVFMPGANLFIGDLHAAQGDGEVIGGAIEVGGTITFKVEVIKGKKLQWPRIETEDRIGAIVSGSDITKAIQRSYAQLVLWLHESYGFDRWDALNLISQTAEMSLGNFNSVVCTVSKRYI